MTQPSIALVGCPNCGKSALFNALTGSQQKVGNYPGVTVEKKYGLIVSSEDQTKTLSVIDLPGLYSLKAASPDEEISVGILTKPSSEGAPLSGVIAVLDSTSLERTLGLALEVKKLGLLSGVALNMMDLAEKQGISIDLKKLSAELGVPVFPTVATHKKGLPELISFMKTIPSQAALKEASYWTPPSYQELKDRADEVKNIVANCVSKKSPSETWTQKIDKVLLHKYLGGPILAVILLTIFQSVFSWAEPIMDAIESSIASLGELVRQVLPDAWFTSLLVDGVIAGVGSVLVFLPQILILFFFIFVLEGSGYMMRAAFIMDHMMNKIGLPGRAFVPLLSSFACSIPGIMATRTLKSQRDRVVTMMIAPLMPCSARLPVYVLLIGAFIPNTPIIGPLKLQGFVMFLVFLTGVLCAMAVAWVHKKLSPEQAKTPCVFELPTYKWPHFGYVVRQMKIRASLFVKNAGKIILLVSLSIWFLASYPKAPENATGPSITYSYAGKIGAMIEPIFAPIGFDWRIATGLIPGFAAREVMVGALGTVFAIEHAEEDEGAMLSLQERIAKTWSLSTGLSLLAWYIFAPQCLATLAVLRRESNSWRYTLFTFGYLLALAYFAAFLVYKVSNFFA